MTDADSSPDPSAHDDVSRPSPSSSRRLTNDDWGLDSNCFVCEQRNASGLQLEIWADDAVQQVWAPFRFGTEHSGAPTLVHGGISLAVLDEVQAWAVIALAKQWALTVETSARFVRGVRLDSDYRAVAEVVDRDGERVRTVGRIETLKGLVCVESDATFQTIGEAAAVRVAGAAIPEAHRHFLND